MSSSTKTYHRIFDHRFGDVFEIYTTHEGEFITACRTLDRLGASPIYYDELEDVPPTHRKMIEEYLEKLQNVSKN